MPRKEADPEELRQLTELFRQHGAEDPEQWAPSQLQEGIPQLAIFCFAKALRERVISKGAARGIDKEIQWADSRPRDRCAEGLAMGVNRQSLTELVRVFQ
jgi:hypothetical protein